MLHVLIVVRASSTGVHDIHSVAQEIMVFGIVADQLI